MPVSGRGPHHGEPDGLETLRARAPHPQTLAMNLNRGAASSVG